MMAADHRPAEAGPRRPALVSHVKAQYDAGLPAALERACAPFGGWSALVSPGERIGVKVNLLRAAPPEKVVTTHPETLRAVLRALKAAGATPFVGDSPGGPGTERRVSRAYEVSGMAAVCREEDVELLVPDTDVVGLAAPGGRLYRSFPVGRCWTTADGIVQVGPLKTHGLMRLTGAVKLTFGCVTGLRKGQLHVRSSERADFADMLLDLHLALAPRLTVIDAIVAMQGKGPGSGTPRAMGSLFVATDGSALDAALADLTVHERRSIYTLAAAARRGLIDLDDPYRLEGDPIVPDRGFQHAPRDAQDRLPPALHRFVRGALHLATAPGERGRLHPLRRLRPDLWRERDHPGSDARVRRRQVRPLLRLHRDLPHRRHPGRQAPDPAAPGGQR